MEKRKAMKAIENLEANEKNTFLADDTTPLRKPECESTGESTSESSNANPMKVLGDQNQNKSSHQRNFDRMRYRRKESSATNPSLQKKVPPCRRSKKRKSPINHQGNVRKARNEKNITKLGAESSANVNGMNITDDTSFLEKDLHTIRTCPVCNVPMLGVVSHYRRSHGVWDSKDRRRYFLRERMRIIRGKISRSYLKSKLRSYGVASDSAIDAISEIFDECGISVEEGEDQSTDGLQLENEESKKNLRSGPITSDVSCKVKRTYQSQGAQTTRTSCGSWNNVSTKRKEGNEDVNTKVDDAAKQSVSDDFSLQSIWISVEDIADKLPV